MTVTDKSKITERFTCVALWLRKIQIYLHSYFLKSNFFSDFVPIDFNSVLFIDFKFCVWRLFIGLDHGDQRVIVFFWCIARCQI